MFEYDKIAIGCNLSSAIYCFYNQIPLIFVDKRKVHPFDFFEPNTDLSLLKIEPLRYDLKRSDEGVTLFGASKAQVYEKMLALLSLSGLIPFSNLVKSMNIGKKYIKVVTNGNKVFNIGYEKLLVFDDINISGLPGIIKTDEDQLVQVLDWFEVNLGATHDIDHIKTNDHFIRDIFFYQSNRASVQSSRKDLVAISYLTTRDAKYEYQYSDTYARFRVIELMKEAGIRGTKNGKNPNYPERSPEPYKWLSPKIELMQREISPLTMPKYRNTKNIKFCYDPPEKIILDNTIKINTYTSKLLNAL